MRASRTKTLIALVLLALLVARVVAAVTIAPKPVSDAQAYDASARRLLEVGTYAYPLQNDILWSIDSGDRVFPDVLPPAYLSAPRNAWTMPGYSAFLALIYWIVGVGAQRWVFVRVAQAILSVGSTALAYAIARRFSRRVALVALAFLALYPPLTLANSYVMTEVLYTFAVLLFAYSYLRWLDKRTLLTACLSGALLAATIWIRPTLAPWIVAATLATIVFTTRDRRRTALQVAVMALATVVVLAPWWARNYQIYNKLVPFGTYNSVNIAEAFRRDFSERQGFPWQRTPPAYSTSDRQLTAIVMKTMGAAPVEITRDAAIGAYYDRTAPELARSMLRDHRAEVFRARLGSIAASLLWPYAVSPAAAGGYALLASWIMHVGFLVLFAFGATRLPRRLDAWLIASIPVYFVVFHAVILPIHRYYFPAAPIALIIAALGFDRYVIRPLRGDAEESSARPAM